MSLGGERLDVGWHCSWDRVKWTGLDADLALPYNDRHEPPKVVGSKDQLLTRTDDTLQM